MAISVSARVALMSAYSLLFLSGIFGNMCVILVILTTKRFRRFISSILITNIAFADFFICLLSSPYYLSCLLLAQPEKPGPERLDSVCKGFIFAAYSLGFTRILLLAIISMERFLAINHPYFYQKHCSLPLPNLRATLACCYPWIHAFLTTSPAGYMKGWVRYVGKAGKLCGYTWEKANLAFVVSLMVVNFCIPLAIIIYTNFKVYQTSRRQRRSIATCFNTNLQTKIFSGNFEEKALAVEADKQKRIGRPELITLNICNKDGNKQVPRLQVSKSQIDENFESERDDDFPIANSFSPSSSQLFSKNEAQFNTANSSNRRHSSATYSRLSYSTNNNTFKGNMGLVTEKSMELSMFSRLDDSGFRDGSSRRYSTLSSGLTLPAGKDSKRGSIFLANESIASARRYLGRLGQFPRRKTIAGVTSSKYPGKTNEFVVFFSTLSVVTLFIFTWLPFVIVTVVILISHTTISEEADLVVSMTTVIDSAFTPFLVLGTRREFRKALLRKLCRLSNS